MKGVHTVPGVPMEAERIQASNEDIIKWYEELADLIKGIPAAFIYNMDETGCSEFVASCKLIVVVPDDYKEETIPVPIDRHSKRSTLTGCVSADGKALKPFVIID
jgi:hypothetical protein